MKNVWIFCLLVCRISADFQELVVNATRLKVSSIHNQIEKFFEIWDSNEGIHIQDFNQGQNIYLINHYQIRDHQLYREPWCKLPFRCLEIEYFISKNLHQLPDMDFLVNTRDKPISMKREYVYDNSLPVLSPFSNDRHQGSSQVKVNLPTWRLDLRKSKSSQVKLRVWQLGFRKL